MFASNPHLETKECCCEEGNRTSGSQQQWWSICNFGTCKFNFEPGLMREKNSCKHTATAWHSKKTESLGKEEIELLQTHFIAASLPRSDPLTLWPYIIVWQVKPRISDCSWLYQEWTKSKQTLLTGRWNLGKNKIDGLDHSDSERKNC